MCKRSAILTAVAVAGVLARGRRPRRRQSRSRDTNNSGTGWLKAITRANHLAGFDRIVIGATGAIRTKTPLPGLETNLAIQGPGADMVSVHGGCATFECLQNNFPLPPTFAIAAGAAVTLRDISITDRDCQGVSKRGFSCEQDAVGNAGTLSLEHTRVYNAAGGGIVNGGTLMVSSEPRDDNVRGIANIKGSTTIRRSTITGSYGAVAVYNRVGKLVSRRAPSTTTAPTRSTIWHRHGAAHHRQQQRPHPQLLRQIGPRAEHGGRRRLFHLE